MSYDNEWWSVSRIETWGYLPKLIVTMGEFRPFFVLPAESNPIFLLTKNIGILFILKILFIFFIGYFYKRNIYPTNFSYYLLLSVLIYGSFVITLACASNIYGIYNPALLEESSHMTTEEKLSGYSIFITVIYIIPMIFNLLVFWLYDKSHKHIIVCNDYFKKRKWWYL